MAERRRKKPCLLLAALSQRVCQLSGMFWQIPLKAEPKAGEELAGTAQLSVKLELQLLATSSSLKNVFFSIYDQELLDKKPFFRIFFRISCYGVSEYLRLVLSLKQGV